MTKAEAMSVGLLGIGSAFLFTLDRTLAESIRRIGDGTLLWYSERLLLPMLIVVGFWVASRRVVKGIEPSAGRKRGESVIAAYTGATLIAWPIVAIATYMFAHQPRFRNSAYHRVPDESPFALHLATLALGIAMLAWSEYRRPVE